MPVTNLSISGHQPFVLRWVGVGERKVRHIRHVAVLARCPRFHHPVNTGVAVVIFLFKDGAVTYVLRVSECDFEVRRTPGDSRSLTVPTYRSLPKSRRASSFRPFWIYCEEPKNKQYKKQVSKTQTVQHENCTETKPGFAFSPQLQSRL